MASPPRLSRRAAQVVGFGLLVLSAALAVALLLVPGDDADDDGPALPPPRELDGVTITPVASVPGASALAAVAGEVRATDTSRGLRYTVDGDTGDVEGPTPYGGLSRLARSEPGPDGTSRWVADDEELHRLDPASGDVVETIALTVPGAITAVGDDALWLTVSGLPEADASGVVAPRSFVQRVDPDSGEVLVVPLDDPETFRFSLGSGTAWVTVGRTLYRLDAQTTAIAGDAELGEPASALEVADGVVLAVVASDPPVVARFDADTLEELAPWDLESGEVGDAAVVAETAELWVLRPDLDAVDRVDLADGSTRSVPVTDPRRIEVDAEGRVWVLSDAEGGTLLRVEP